MLQREYTPDCMDKRNRYMVDHADLYSRSMEWMPQRYREYREICPPKEQDHHRHQSGFP